MRISESNNRKIIKKEFIMNKMEAILFYDTERKLTLLKVLGNYWRKDHYRHFSYFFRMRST